MWSRILNTIVGVLIVCALALVCTEVVLRYYFPRYLKDWGLEFTIYFTVWAVFLCGGALVRESRHIRADILLQMMPPSVQRLLEIVAILAGLAFTGVLTGYGARMVWIAYTLGEKSESSAKFPLYLYYLALPVGTGLMMIELLRRLYLFVFKFDPNTMRVTHDDVIRDK